MAVYRCSFIFHDVRWETGFTHTWWTTAADAVTAGGQVANYGGRYLGCCLSNIHWTYLRISNVDKGKDAFFFDVSTTGPTVGALDPVVNGQSEPTTCLLIRRDNTSLYSLMGKLFFHGMPQKIFPVDRDYTKGALAAWDTAFAALQTEIEGGQYSIMKKAGGVKTAQAVDTLIIRYMTSHRVGRPFDQLRGTRRIA